jgi:hypothetical protein
MRKKIEDPTRISLLSDSLRCVRISCPGNFLISPMVKICSAVTSNLTKMGGSSGLSFIFYPDYSRIIIIENELFK